MSITILTVEDEPAIRSILVAFLEDHDYTAIEACDGGEALHHFRNQRPDLVLCDLRMPGMDGLELLSTMVREGPEVPVIIVSGAGRMQDAIEALKRGAWDYITKPIIDMEILERAIVRSLERARLIRENREYQAHLERLNRELTQALGQLREDEEAARMLQTRILPEHEQVLGPYRFRQRMFSSMYLSGDFLDFFPIDDQHTGFYMADVSGHGAASAMVTVMLKTLFEKHRQQLMIEGDRTICVPEATLSQLNQDLCRLKLEKYLTIFYGVLDAGRNNLHYCSGGQFPYPILCAGKEIRYLDGHNQPVGLFEDAEFSPHHINLPDRFHLVLMSDGILELVAGDAAGSRMKRLVSQLTGTDFSLETLIEEFSIGQQRELPDDIALLSLSRGDQG